MVFHHHPLQTPTRLTCPLLLSQESPRTSDGHVQWLIPRVRSWLQEGNSDPFLTCFSPVSLVSHPETLSHGYHTASSPCLLLCPRPPSPPNMRTSARLRQGFSPALSQISFSHSFFEPLALNHYFPGGEAPDRKADCWGWFSNRTGLCSPRPPHDTLLHTGRESKQSYWFVLR